MCQKLKNRIPILKHTFFIYFLCFFFACNNSNSTNSGDSIVLPKVSLINYKVISYHPHDTTSFTEGLVVHNNQIFESTGSPEEFPQTRSIIGPLDVKTGIINKKIELVKHKYFGEGIVFLGDTLFQLTYTSQIGFIYNANTFKKIGTFNFKNKEGWGLTTDGIDIIMSDGTNEIYFIDPKNFTIVKTINVTEYGVPQDNLNELEFIKGFIYANVYTTNFIVKINPQTGAIIAKIDFTLLATDAKSKNPSSLEMNGIAYDSSTNKIYITGKLWPYIYTIQLL